VSPSAGGCGSRLADRMEVVRQEHDPESGNRFSDKIMLHYGNESVID
jgi:hypothetical protein